MFSAKVLADSINKSGDRLVTVEATYPRFVHTELMTHRVFSRNAASSRAIPIKQKIRQVEDDPVIPISWGLNQAGMQARKEADPDIAETAEAMWRQACKAAVIQAELLMELGMHKQIVNRVIEPFTWITVIISSTSWKHFFNLRCHEDAEPHIAKIAAMIYREIEGSKPEKLKKGELHLPLVSKQERKDWSPDMLMKISAGRCARVSYLTHDGKRDPMKDIQLHDRLLDSGHWSPFEHVGIAFEDSERSGNFVGFEQYRKRFVNEFVPG